MSLWQPLTDRIACGTILSRRLKASFSRSLPDIERMQQGIPLTCDTNENKVANFQGGSKSSSSLRLNAISSAEAEKVVVTRKCALQSLNHSQLWATSAFWNGGFSAMRFISKERVSVSPGPSHTVGRPTPFPLITHTRACTHMSKAINFQFAQIESLPSFSIRTNDDDARNFDSDDEGGRMPSRFLAISMASEYQRRVKCENN